MRKGEGKTLLNAPAVQSSVWMRFESNCSLFSHFLLYTNQIGALLYICS
jgi:hypothetical protein